jgi:RNA polymerase sigma factor (sigma-70 family)
MIRLADGDRSAFSVIFEMTLPPVGALARKMLTRQEDAEEASQQALLKVFERACEYDPTRGEALPWILGVAAWECRSFRTRLRRRREDPAEVLQTVPMRGHSPEDAATLQELLVVLESVMGGLSEGDREVLEAMLDRRDRPLIAPGTFRQRLRRARIRLQRAWEEHSNVG